MVSALIVGAGKGTRMGTGADKLFIELMGRPVLAHTWGRFDTAPCIDEVVVVVREEQIARVQELAQRFRFTKPYRVIVGGAQRQDSVWNGLQAVSEQCALVAIQDAARPCTPGALITAIVEAARETGAAVAAQPVTDTIKESTDGLLVHQTLDRTRLWAAQTPQTFRVEIIKRAIAEARRRGLVFTDDTAACELIGQPVRLVLSDRPNPKLTRPEDLGYIEFLLQQEMHSPSAPRHGVSFY